MGAWEWRSRLYSLDARRVFTPPAFFLSFRRKPESRANRARNAHIRAMAAAGGGASLWLSVASSLRPEGARSARFIRWIPAFAGMARWGHGNGEGGHGNGGVGFIRWMPIGFLHRLLFFCHSGESRNPAQKERGTRTYARWRRQATARVYGCPPRPRAALKEREARALYAGFPPLFKPGARSARDWRGGAWISPLIIQSGLIFKPACTKKNKYSHCSRYQTYMHSADATPQRNTVILLVTLS